MRTRVWPVDAGELAIDTPLLIADGHHRYETAVAYRAENPEATHTFAILVSSRAPGLEIFPTHRLVAVDRRCPGRGRRRTRGKVSRSTATASTLRVTDRRRLRAACRRVVRSPEGVSYTAYADEAIAAVDRGDAAAAFLLQPVTVDQVAAFATRARRCRRSRRSSTRSSHPACSLPVDDRLAQLVPRGARRRRAGARRPADAAEREPVVGAGEGGDDTTAIDAAAEASILTGFARATPDDRQRRGRRRRRRVDHGRCRPDRRLAEREARHPVLLDLDRGRRRRHDGRRLLRLRLRLRRGRGVDCDARRRGV